MSGTILLADDSLTIQKVVELTFADTGHTVVTVSSGDELLEKLPGVRPDLVICDVVMPGTDGYSVCQTLKSDPATLHIPVVLLTGTFEPFDRDRALAAGCDEIITKPFEARKLVAAVESLLQPAEETPTGVPQTETEAGGGRFEGAVTPPSGLPPIPPPVEEFGTHLASPPEAEAAADVSEGSAWPEPDSHEQIEFATTGFAEMEAAGKAAAEGEPADASLDADHATDEPAVEDEFEFPAAEPEVSAFGETAPEPSEVPPAAEAEPFATPAEAPTPPSWTAEPVSAEAEAPEPFTAPDEEAPPLGSVTTPVVMPAVEPPAMEEPPEPAPTELAPEAEDAAPGTPGPASGALSDDDVERIANRVVELFADRLEQIAWEVIPDMAEIVVRERIRRLEAEVEEEHPDATH